MWVYLLKDRTQVPDVIKTFYNEIKTQFSTSIHILRAIMLLSIWKLMFLNFMLLITFYIKLLFAYLTANGVVERKHMHILHVDRTLTVQMNVPKYHWTDVIPCACYLINWMPSSEFHRKFIFSCLYPNTHVHTRSSSFCTCFVQDLRPRLNKLSPGPLNVSLLVTLELKNGILVLIRCITCILLQVLLFF